LVGAGTRLGENDYASTTGDTTLSRAQLASHEHPHTFSIPSDPTGGAHDHLGGSGGGLGNTSLPPGREFYCGEFVDTSGEPGNVDALTVSKLTPSGGDLPCPTISGGDHSHSIEAETRPIPAGANPDPAHDHTYAANNRPAFRRLYYLIRVL
jgi:hypothetical protein